MEEDRVGSRSPQWSVVLEEKQQVSPWQLIVIMRYALILYASDAA
jgi:hypothetical protein